VRPAEGAPKQVLRTLDALEDVLVCVRPGVAVAGRLRHSSPSRDQLRDRGFCATRTVR
jgi:hypothetical protein